MSQVAQLKELLFQPESEAIAKLSQRVEDVFDRAGTDARFEASVTRSIDGALRAAEAAKHGEVAGALAPLVVKTIKTEIGNSTDELVEALYPATGRMVKAYVANAIRELTESINRRLEENPLMLRLSAWTSGQSAGELALADSQTLKVEDVFLIRRATGELLARWPGTEAGLSLDHVFGGVLTAINEFTSEAFRSQGSSLREIDLGEQRIYLRASPSFLVAARCTGTAASDAERIFDDEFLAFVDRSRGDLEAASGEPPRAGAAPGQNLRPRLKELTERLQGRLSAIAPARATLKRGMRPLTLIVILFAVPLFAWLAWGAYSRYVEGRAFETARGIIEATPDMLGYPSDVKVDAGGRAVTILGLAPTTEVGADVLRRIKEALPNVEVRDRLNAVPAGTDFGPFIAELRKDQTAFEAQVATASESRMRARAAALFTRSATVLQAEAQTLEPDAAAALSRFAQEARDIAASLDGPGGRDTTAAIDKAAALESRIAAAARITLEIGAAPAGDTAHPPAKGDITNAAERLAFASQSLAERSAMKRRLARETSILKAQADALKSDTAALKAEIAALSVPKITPREALAQFTRSHAIFFSDGTTFRDPAGTETLLDQLAGLMARDTSLIRIVGYTDDAGTPATNLTLAQARGDAVASGLTARGVPPGRLVVLRRTSPENNVSPVSGSGSSNRRVEFEIGFVGEGGE